MTALNPAAPLIWLLVIVTLTYLARRAASAVVAWEDRRRPVERARSHVSLRQGEGD